MKKSFTEPEIQVVLLDGADIITASVCETGGGQNATQFGPEL